MSVNSQNRIRVAVDLANPFAAPKNLITQGTPKFPEARACRVDVGVYDHGLFQASVAQFDSMTLELIAYSSIIGARLVAKTVAAPFNIVTENAWLDIGDQHCTFEMTASEMSVFTFGSTTPPIQALWMVITALDGSERVTLAAGAATAVRDGGVYAGSSAPAAGNPAYLTGAETLAAIKAHSAQTRIVDNGKEYIPQVDDDGIVTWHWRTL